MSGGARSQAPERADETTHAPERARAPALGILAGMGPRSTGPFLDLVLDACQQHYGAADDLDFPLIHVCSMPVPFFPGAAAHDGEAEFRALREGLQRVDTPDAGVLAIACNTAHVHLERLRGCVSAPLLDMVALAADTVPGGAAVAVLCSQPTADARLYPDALHARGVRVVKVDWQADVDALIALTRRRPDAATLQHHWSVLFAKAAHAGASTVLVACLDLSAAPAAAPAGLRVIDAARCLADALVVRWCALGGGVHRRAVPAPAQSLNANELIVGNTHYRLSHELRDQDPAAVHHFLATAYWSEGIPAATVERAMRHSLCFALWRESDAEHTAPQLAGFARVVTDRSTFAYMCDVFIHPSQRGRGLGRWLVQRVLAQPSLQGLRRFMLATRDAHTLYARHGFATPAAPDRLMEIVQPDLYRRAAAARTPAQGVR
jgi:aspartate/glutamate racemase/GNAT superfamily N-acetyltransferase